MSIEISTIQQIQERMLNALILAVNSGETNTAKHLTDVRNSFANALVSSLSAGFDEVNDVLKQLIIQLFPDTATGEFLERWAAIFGITRDSGVKATGKLVFTGSATSTIPSATLIQKADGTQYTTQSSGTISSQLISVSSITRSGTTATVTTVSDHGLATGVEASIAGANESDYNGTFVISVTDTDKFTYEVSGSPSSPATGTITSTSTYANVLVEALEIGAAGNASGGSQLSLVSPVAGVDDTCYVGFNGLRNGTDIESDESLRARLLQRTANLTSAFASAGIESFIKESIAGITRIWVEDATPSAGYVTIYFTRDNETPIIPTSAQALAVKNAIIEPTTGIKPANTPDSYVIVNPPTPVSVDFTFTALSPNTEAMQSAITNSLTDYFKSNSVNIATDITPNEYNSIIFSTIDADGNRPTFTLSAPSGTISVASGELAILGTITYP